MVDIEVEEPNDKADVFGMKVIDDCSWGKIAWEYNGVEETEVVVVELWLWEVLEEVAGTENVEDCNYSWEAWKGGGFTKAGPDINDGDPEADGLEVCLRFTWWSLLCSFRQFLLCNKLLQTSHVAGLLLLKLRLQKKQDLSLFIWSDRELEDAWSIAELIDLIAKFYGYSHGVVSKILDLKSPLWAGLFW